MANSGLTPYQMKLLKEWKGECIEVQFTNPRDPNIVGRIREVDIHRNVFMLRTLDKTEMILFNGIKTFKK